MVLKAERERDMPKGEEREMPGRRIFYFLFLILTLVHKIWETTFLFREIYIFSSPKKNA